MKQNQVFDILWFNVYDQSLILLFILGLSQRYPFLKENQKLEHCQCWDRVNYPSINRHFHTIGSNKKRNKKFTKPDEFLYDRGSQNQLPEKEEECKTFGAKMFKSLSLRLSGQVMPLASEVNVIATHLSCGYLIAYFFRHNAFSEK